MGVAGKASMLYTTPSTVSSNNEKFCSNLSYSDVESAIDFDFDKYVEDELAKKLKDTSYKVPSGASTYIPGVDATGVCELLYKEKGINVKEYKSISEVINYTISCTYISDEINCSNWCYGINISCSLNDYSSSWKDEGY